jgi:predicted nucleic acid-binding protein
MTVIDASVVVASLSEEARSDQARMFLGRSKGDLEAPSIMMLEVRSAMTKRFAAGNMTKQGLDVWPQTIISIVSIVPLDMAIISEALLISSRSIELAVERGDARPFPASIYDCCYIALALMIGGGLATFDMRQAALAREVGVPVLPV